MEHAIAVFLFISGFDPATGYSTYMDYGYEYMTKDECFATAEVFNAPFKTITTGEGGIGMIIQVCAPMLEAEQTAPPAPKFQS